VILFEALAVEKLSKFYRKFPESAVPFKAKICRTVAECHAKGSVLDKKKPQQGYVLTTQD
jgi:hypothetical protein